MKADAILKPGLDVHLDLFGVGIEYQSLGAGIWKSLTAMASEPETESLSGVFVAARTFSVPKASVPQVAAKRDRIRISGENQFKKDTYLVSEVIGETDNDYDLRCIRED